MSTNPSELSPKHVKAARALLAWAQQDLAKAAGVATSTVADFERGHRTPVAANAQAIRRALEDAGVRFLEPTGAVIGPAVPSISSNPKAGMPVRWVSAVELAAWSEQKDAAYSLPTLISHLIRATHGATAHVRFPSDEGVRHPGLDGFSSVTPGSAYVPEGDAGWELSSQGSNIAQKATRDYQKRSAEPAPLDPKACTFVFVTSRQWPGKDQWAKDREAKGIWRNVKAYDANDLVHWIEQTPAVGLWLASRLNKRPDGVRELDAIWQEWSKATTWPLSEDLVLCDRDLTAVQVLRWLRNPPSTLSLKASTTEEVMAFVFATLGMLPDELSQSYRMQCLVVNAAGARALTTAPASLTLLLTEPDPGLAATLVERGHHVLQAYDDRRASRGEVHTLERPSREGIADALADMGIALPRAQALARDSARNLSVLRRLIPSAPGRVPEWARQAPPRALLAGLLIGGWVETNEADRAKLSELAGESYEDAVATLTSYVGDFDRPLQKIGEAWRIASPFDAWPLLASYLTAIDIERFEGAALAVLGVSDPRFEMESDKRWMASFHDIKPVYSGILRHGIGQTLILLALYGETVSAVPDAGRRADAVVRGLLLDADRRRWWSLARDFRLLAEASPRSFLDAIEDSLDQEEPAIGALFGTDEGGVFDTEHLSDLLWALESLAWSPELMPRVSLVLARLDAIDNPPGKYANRPANSLREIHLLWGPQTYATLAQRIRAIDLVRKRENDAAWKLLLGILPRGHDHSSPSPLPLWRDFSVDKIEAVTWGLVARGASAVANRLLEDVGTNAERWMSLIGRLADFGPDLEKGIGALEKTEPLIADPQERMKLWTKLREQLHHHREFPDAEWSMPPESLNDLESIYNRFSPGDPVERVAWLFDQSVPLPNPSTEGWEADELDAERERQQAAKTLFQAGGVEAILKLARIARMPALVGKSLYESQLADSDFDSVLTKSLSSDNKAERALAHGLVVSAFDNRKTPWALQLLQQAQNERWGREAVLTILLALPLEHWVWKQAALFGPEIEGDFWRRLPAAFWREEDSSKLSFAIRKLIDVGRARHVLPIAARRGQAGLPSDLLVEALGAAVKEELNSGEDGNEARLNQHYVVEILNLLDERDDVDRGTLASLEWQYLPLLEHSARGAKALLGELAESPEMFVQLLQAAFRPSEDSGIEEDEPQDPARAQALASRAYDLLDLWDRIPGTRKDGTTDGAALEGWIKRARLLAKEIGRDGVADGRIGQVLSASAMGADGNWPDEAVRDVLDLYRSKRMTEGFQIGKMNRRGMTTRMPRAGGIIERGEAAGYREWAKALSYTHPHTAKALESLAETYEEQAKRQDEHAQRLDWE